MDILWILVQVISPIFGIMYILALSPWRFSKRATLTAASILIIALTTVNILAVKHYYPMVSSFPYLDILYRIANTALVSAVIIIFIDRRPKDPFWMTRALFGLLSVCACAFVVDTVAITIRTLLGQYPLELLFELLLYPLMLLVVIKIREPFLEVTRYMNNRLWPLCLVPLILVCAILTQISIIAPLEQNPGNIPVALWLCVITVAVYGIIFYLFRTLRAQNALEQNTAAFRLYISSLEQQNELTNKNAEKAALFRHDIRHVTQMMSACAENGDMDGVKELIKLLDKNVSADGGLAVKPITGHRLLDTVLNNYLSLAAEAHIDISINVTDIAAVSADLTELAVVLANALENAVNACKKQPAGEKRSISVTGRRRGKQFFLEVSNTFTGEVCFGPDSGLPVSCEKGHGTGSRSIAFFAEKYRAVLQYTVDGGLFCLRLLLRLD